MIYRVTFPLKFYKIKLHNMFFIVSHLPTTAFFLLLYYYKNNSPPRQNILKQTNK